MRDNSIRSVLGLTALATLLIGLGVARPARAEHPADPEYGATYARVRYVQGEANLQSLREGAIDEAVVNDPLESGDRVSTGYGRMEIELADGAIVWLDEATVAEFQSLSDVADRYGSTNLIALVEGSLRIDTQEAGDSEPAFQIDTRAGSVYLLSEGSFRIDAEGDVATVSAFRGVVEISGDKGSVLVRSGERTSVRAGDRPGDPRPFNTLRLDEFDRFHDERIDAYVRRGGSEPIEEIRREVPAEVRPFVLELSVYGGWHHHGIYGWVWRPAYHGGWGPYVEGRWVWYPTGWVWVSYDPWGWAPYHYGRWDHVVDLGWIWIPGSRWSGAWVTFAVGSSYIGWCPLNYYNYPVYHDRYFGSYADVRVDHLRGRGWRFAKLGVFGSRLGARDLIGANRLPRGTDVVITGGLPRFDPRRVASHETERRTFIHRVRESRKAVPGVAASGDRVPFRKMERAPRPSIRRDDARGRVPGVRTAPAPRGPAVRSRDGRQAPSRYAAPDHRSRRPAPERGERADRDRKQRADAAPAPPSRLHRAADDRDRVVDRLMRNIRNNRSRSRPVAKEKAERSDGRSRGAGARANTSRRRNEGDRPRAGSRSTPTRRPDANRPPRARDSRPNADKARSRSGRPSANRDRSRSDRSSVNNHRGRTGRPSANRDRSRSGRPSANRDRSRSGRPSANRDRSRSGRPSANRARPRSERSSARPSSSDRSSRNRSSSGKPKDKDR